MGHRPKPIVRQGTCARSVVHFLYISFQHLLVSFVFTAHKRHEHRTQTMQNPWANNAPRSDAIKRPRANKTIAATKSGTCKSFSLCMPRLLFREPHGDYSFSRLFLAELLAVLYHYATVALVYLLARGVEHVGIQIKCATLYAAYCIGFWYVCLIEIDNLCIARLA